MYIKSIIINGFRSYRDQNQLTELSPKHNVIIGRNGSGKSNIFNAIQFILSDEFSHLTAQQRQQLIHESHSNTRIMTAFVELIVDNSDHRMPIDSTQIHFRRQIGFKKDQFFINGKIFLYSDVVNLLETAGFTRSNPYYIVKQGKINEMAISSDEYRLNVMREVAGTRIYDQRKTEALKLLSDSQQKISQISDCLQFLNEKLNHLETEKQELTAFLKWDKRRRFLEYSILNMESESAKNNIDIFETKQSKINDILEDKRIKLIEIQDMAESVGQKLEDIRVAIIDCRTDLNEINADIEDCAEQKANIESRINDLKEKSVYDLKTEDKTEKELEEVKEAIARKKKRLLFVNSKYEQIKKKEKEVFQEMKRKQRRKIELYEKQKRKDSFSTIEDRNQWISSELTKLHEEIESKRKRISTLKAEAFAITNEKSKLEDEENGFIAEEENLIKTLQNEKKQLSDLNRNIKLFEAKRMEYFESENELKQLEAKLNEDKLKIERNLIKLSGNSATVGRESVYKVLDIFRQKSRNSREEELALKPLIDGYYGQVIDCLSCDPNLNKAIEVTAKSKLFYHIIQNDRIGTTIIKEVNKMKLFGDITFIALNQIVIKDIKYPNANKDAVPITSLIKFDKKYEKVMRYLFDRTLICRNLEIGTTLARSCRLDCVTVDGDFVSCKGPISGGYFGRNSRIESFLNWKNTLFQMEDIQTKLRQSETERETNEQKLSEDCNRFYTLDIQHNKTQRKLTNLKFSKHKIRQQMIDLQNKYESFDRSIICLDSTLPPMIANRDSFNSELKLSLSSQLNENETKEMSKLLNDCEQLRSVHSDLCQKRIQLEKEKSSLEKDLDQNLKPRQNELEFTLIELKISNDDMDLESETNALNAINQKMVRIGDTFQEKMTKIDDLVKQENDAQLRLENIKLAEDKQFQIINNENKKLRKLANKCSNFQKKLEECHRKLRCLGTIPGDPEPSYTNLSLLEQYEKLRKCNQKLSQLPNVNQKALEQYNEGQQRSVALFKVKQDLDISYASIQQLVDSLEHKKYEAIQFTYRQVSAFFKEIFAKLVPKGKAFIDMIYSDTRSNAGSTQSSQDSQSSGGISASGQAVYEIDNFIGVKIRVAFTGSATIKELNQLSGGQKSIVALAFIFAIQKCDPQPFYLFDEVDQALDPIYRKGLADMISESSQNTQFITTTFRPQLLDCAHKFFGVKFRNRVSHVEEISAEEAMDFIEDDMTEQSAK